MGNLSIMIHGDSGTGKSYLVDTAPAPRLILDIEGGHQYTPSKKVYWDLSSGNPPPKTTDSCVATVKDFKVLNTAFQWLQSGNHPFKSVAVDSLTELQKRAMDELVGTEAMKMNDWGTILRRLEGLVRAFRDLTMANGKPGLQCVAFVTGTKMKDGKIGPLIQGQLADTLAYHFDVCGYMHMTADPDGGLLRHLLVQPVNGIISKDRTGRLGYQLTNPNLTAMLALLNQEESK